MKFKPFIYSLFLALIIFHPVTAHAEAPEAFVKRYIETVNERTDLKTYSSHWRAYTRKYLHDTDEGTAKELRLSAKMHKLFLEYGDFNALQEKHEWGDATGSISYTYKLKEPVPNDVMADYFMMGPADYNHFQITVEKDGDSWVVSGESFVGNM